MALVIGAHHWHGLSDTRVVEQLAEQQAQSRVRGVQTRSGTESEEAAGEQTGLSVPARALLKFSTPRDPAQLAAFINLRLLNPEHTHWRCGIEAATLYHQLHRDLRVPFTYRVPTAAGRGEAEDEAWPASLASFPLGQWIADARRFYTRGDMDDRRIAQLEKLGMVWSHFDVAWEEGLAAARGWAAEGAPPGAAGRHLPGVPGGHLVEERAAAARKAAEIEQRRAEGIPVESGPGRCHRSGASSWRTSTRPGAPPGPSNGNAPSAFVRQHLAAGGQLPMSPGVVVHQGEDLGRWVRSVRLGWDKLTTVQQWMCEHILGIEPAGEDEKPQPRRTQADKWALNYAAAQRYYVREGHLRVPRKHTERIVVNGPDGQDQEERDLRLGAWVSNQRSRAAALSPERVEQLSTIGMRWT
ncbi:helicase associated domain-containing protein [Streptomyces sp. NPDC003480]